MNVLVIGGCGFIGSHIVDALVAGGHFVRVLARTPERFRDPLPGVDYRYGSFADRMSLVEALMGIDVVFHAASTTFPGTANLDPSADVQDNLVATIRLLDLMRDMNIPKIVFLSSGGTIYGVPEIVPTPEDHPLRPVNSYGIVKAAIEHYLAMYTRVHGLNHVSVRASNPYGERQGHSGVQGVISTFLSRIQSGSAIEIWGDDTIERDYLHVTDLAELSVRAAESDFSGAVNAGSGVGTSLREIVDGIRTVTGKDVEILRKPGRLTDVPRSVLDVSRAKSELGWSTDVSLADGLSRTWAWVDREPTG